MQIILYSLLFTYFFVVLLTLVSAFFSSKVYLKAAPTKSKEFFESNPLTILKPITNLEPNLKENLITFFTQDYPLYFLNFCLEKNHPDIQNLINEVAQKFPKVSYRIYTDSVNVGLNPKVNNIYNAFRDAETEWVLISDSNVNAEKDYLKKMVSYIDENVASISNTIMGIRPKTLASHIESVFLNVFYSKWAGTLAYFGKTAVVGKGLLIHKKSVQNIGGLEAISPFLAEDFMLGKLLQEKGYKTILAAHGVSEIVGHQNLRAVYKRHLRWGLIRKTSWFLGFLFEPLAYPFVSSTIGALAVSLLFKYNFFTILFISLFGFLILDLIQFRNFSKKIYALTPLAWFAKEMLSLVLWFDILRSKSIYWRDKKFSLSKDTKLVFD